MAMRAAQMPRASFLACLASLHHANPNATETAPHRTVKLANATPGIDLSE